MQILHPIGLSSSTAMSHSIEEKFRRVSEAEAASAYGPIHIPLSCWRVAGGCILCFADREVERESTDADFVAAPVSFPTLLRSITSAAASLKVAVSACYLLPAQKHATDVPNTRADACASQDPGMQRCKPLTPTSVSRPKATPVSPDSPMRHSNTSGSPHLKDQFPSFPIFPHDCSELCNNHRPTWAPRLAER